MSATITIYDRQEGKWVIPNGKLKFLSYEISGDGKDNFGN